MINVKRTLENRLKLPFRGVVALISIIVVLSVFFIYQYNVVKSWSSRIYPGVKVEKQDLAGKSKEQAKEILREKYIGEVYKSSVNVKTDDRNYILDYNKINIKYNIDETVNQAFNYGKNVNMLEKFKLIKFPTGAVIRLKFTYDKKTLDNFLSDIQKSVDKEPLDAQLIVNGDNLKVVKEKNGRKLQKDKLQKDVLTALGENIGVNTNIKTSVKLLNARITAKKISSINTKISAYTTDYGSISSYERANNIELATSSINGKILLPGDEFSFNKVVGERTAERGYMSAPVIIGNQVDSGLGGGICQVSTTLYNAVLRANIKSTQRSHHTMPSHYVPVGMDATVDYGNIDYKFKNTLKYPIYIFADSSGGAITFEIYSNSELSNIVTDISSKVYQKVDAKLEYQNDSSLPEGQTEVMQAPSTGYRVKVIKTVTKDGKVISSELISDDYYEPINGIVKRGTQKQGIQKQEPQSPETNNPNQEPDDSISTDSKDSETTVETNVDNSTDPEKQDN